MHERSVLDAAVTQFLEHLQEDAPDGEIGVVGIIAEIHHQDEDGDEASGISFWISDSRRWVQHGLLSTASYMALDLSMGDDG